MCICTASQQGVPEAQEAPTGALTLIRPCILYCPCSWHTQSFHHTSQLSRQPASRTTHSSGACSPSGWVQCCSRTPLAPPGCCCCHVCGVWPGARAVPVVPAAHLGKPVVLLLHTAGEGQRL
jgi:hypothetical protein